MKKIDFNYLLKNNYINKWKLLLENYNKIKITNDELILILFIMYKSDDNKKFILPSELVMYTNFSESKIEDLHSSLTSKKLIEIKMSDNGSLEMDLTLLFKKIVSVICIDSDNENNDNFKKNSKLTTFNWLVD